MDNNPFRSSWQQPGGKPNRLSDSGIQYQYPSDQKNPYSSGAYAEQAPPPYSDRHAPNGYGYDGTTDRWGTVQVQQNYNQPLSRLGHPQEQYNQGYGQPPPAQQHQYGPPQGQRPSPQGGRYRPQIGFVNLPPRFYMWCRIRGLSGKLIIEMGPQPLMNPSYVSKESSGGSRQSFEDGNGYGQIIAEASVKGMFSSKSILSFNGYQTEMQKEKKSYYFTAPIDRRTEPFEWRRTHGRSMILVPRHAPPQAPPLAIWSAKDETIKNNAELGMFEFQAPVVSGELGDIFITLSVMALARIYQCEYQQRLAANGSAAAASAASAVAVSS